MSRGINSEENATRIAENGARMDPKRVEKDDTVQNQTSGTPSRRLKKWIRELPVRRGLPDVQKSAGTSA